MKRYVSLASALLVGTVVGQWRVEAEPAIVSVTEVSALKESKIAAKLEAKKPVYASDVSSLTSDKQDVQAKSNKTSPRDVAANKKSTGKSSATSARVADVQANDDSSVTTTPDEVQEVDTSVTTSNTSADNVEANETSVDTSNTSDAQDVEADETSVETSNTSDAQDVEADETSVSSATTANVEADNDSSSCTSDAQDVEAEGESSVSSSATSAEGMNAGYSPNVESSEANVENEESSEANVEITDEDIERMMMSVAQTVKIERGYVGNCGIRYNFPIYDTYWCYDTSLGYRTHCYVASPNIHKCCPDFDGCDEGDLKIWRF
jgi:hypothetical protein